jgi:hypothetical protein
VWEDYYVGAKATLRARARAGGAIAAAGPAPPHGEHCVGLMAVAELEAMAEPGTGADALAALPL